MELVPDLEPLEELGEGEGVPEAESFPPDPVALAL
jgi:hypothetical protein